MKRHLYLTLVLFVFTNIIKAQLITNKTLTPEQLVKNILLGKNVVVSNITAKGGLFSIGSFSGNTNIGFSSGIVLASNDINECKGPNNDPAAGQQTNGGSDPDLVQITNNNIYDAQILEFDFYSNSNFVSFEYVFGSDEYPEFVDSPYNDVFAFFISGPGISGPYSNGAINIALLPNSNTSVSINNVNNKLNQQYYVSNGDGKTGPQLTDNTVIQYDGFTQVLTASHEIQPCQTYHLKIAIGDVYDSNYGSGVFLKANSLSATNINTSIQYSMGNSLVENCANANITFDLGEIATTDYTVNLSYYGSAVNGIDVNLLPSSITIAKNQSSKSISVTAIGDNVAEGFEKLYMIAQTSLCTKDTIEILINDNSAPIIDNLEKVTSCNENGEIVAQVHGGQGTINYEWTPNLSNTATINFNIKTNPTISLKVSDQCGNSTIKNFSTQITPPTINAGNDTTICSGSAIVIGEKAESSYSYSWIANAHLNNTSTAQPTFSYEMSNGEAEQKFTQIVQKSKSNCVNVDTIVVTVLPLTKANITNTNPTCYNQCDASVKENSAGNFYQWEDSKHNVISKNAQANNLCANKYFVTFSDMHGCINKDSVTILNPEKMKFVTIATQEPKCFGGNDGEIAVVSITGKTPFTYKWNTGATSSTIQNISAGKFDVSVKDINNCSIDTSITIKQPSELKLLLQSDTTICINSCAEITASSTGGTGVILYNWKQHGDGATKSLCINEIQKSYEVSATDANSCSTPSKIITVKPQEKPTVTINVSNQKQLICAGDEITLSSEAQKGIPPYHYYWEHSTEDSKEIKVSPTKNTTYKVKVKDACNVLSNTDSVDIKTQEKPSFNYSFIGNSGCPSVTVNLENKSNTQFSKTKWTMINNSTSKENILYGNKAFFSLSEPGHYTPQAELTTNEGCNFYYSLSNSVDVWQTPKANFIITEDNISTQSPTINTLNKSSNANTYEWTLFEKENKNIFYTQNCSHTYSDSGSYNIQLVAMSQQGCTDTMVQTLRVRPEPTLFIPNAFTPNGDGINDEFQARGTNINKFQITIFDRWGQIAFESDNINVAWNGKYRNTGDFCQTDSYVYCIYFTNIDNKLIIRRGLVSIIK